MVVIIPKKRHCKKTLTVGGVALLMAVMVVACFTTGTKMTAWTDFVGMGAEGLEGGKSAIFPRSLSPLDYEKVIWSDSSESDNIEDGSEGVMEERDGVRDTDDEDTEPSDDLMGGGKVLVLDKREASLNLLDDFHLLVDNFNGQFVGFFSTFFSVTVCQLFTTLHCGSSSILKFQVWWSPRRCMYTEDAVFQFLSLNFLIDWNPYVSVTITY